MSGRLIHFMTPLLTPKICYEFQKGHRVSKKYNDKVKRCFCIMEIDCKSLQENFSMVFQKQKYFFKNDLSK